MGLVESGEALGRDEAWGRSWRWVMDWSRGGESRWCEAGALQTSPGRCGHRVVGREKVARCLQVMLNQAGLDKMGPGRQGGSGARQWCDERDVCVLIWPPHLMIPQKWEETGAFLLFIILEKKKKPCQFASLGRIIKTKLFLSQQNGIRLTLLQIVLLPIRERKDTLLKSSPPSSCSSLIHVV